MIAYGDMGIASFGRDIGALWDAYMTQIQPIAARVSYIAGIGNHEHDPSGAPLPGGFHPAW